MGGLGSGGWNHSGRSTVEERPKLAISALQKAGALRAGAARTWRWSVGGRECASIGVYGAGDAVRLEYSVSADSAGASRRVNEHVGIAWRPCRFGGERPFFDCPRCGRPVLNLHLAGGRFRCRNCAQCTYASRRERERDRNLRAANKLRQRLGGEAGAFNSIAERPKGMWRRTYERIVAEIKRREGHAFEELAGWMMKLEARGRRRSGGFWR